MPKVLNEKINDVFQLSKDIFCIRLCSPHLARNYMSGQFVHIKCSDGQDLSLRRPISICDVNRDTETVDIVFQVKGRGTSLLSKKKKGDMLDVMGPLGNHFSQDNHKKIVVVGGGIGIFPLLYLLRSHEEKCESRTAILGFRNKDAIVMENEFRNASDRLLLATDDGSYGIKGFTTDLLLDEIKNQPDMIFACGPLPMLKKVAAIAAGSNIPCEISLEERMGCGIGACLVCACKTKKEQSPGSGDEWEYSHICKKGPVYNSREVVFDD